MCRGGRRSHLVYRALSASSVPALVRTARAGAQIFCFHNVLPRSEMVRGDDSLHMPVAHFEELLQWIGTAYRVVPLSDLTRLLASNRSGRALRGLAALTFDDAYDGFFEHGLPVLARHELPATMFVVSDAASRPQAFWWDRLGVVARLTDLERHRHLNEGRGASQEILGSMGAELGDPPAFPHSLLPATWNRIRESLQGQDLVTIGAHTATHPNLTRMSDRELEHELVEPRERIEARLDIQPDVVSYPYGLHDRRVREAAGRAGYRAGVTLDPGPMKPSQEPLALPRLNVPAHIGVEALECWAAGLRPRRGA